MKKKCHNFQIVTLFLFILFVVALVLNLKTHYSALVALTDFSLFYYSCCTHALPLYKDMLTHVIIHLYFTHKYTYNVDINIQNACEIGNLWKASKYFKNMKFLRISSSILGVTEI